MKTPRKTPKTDATTEATATDPNAESPVEPQAPLILGPEMGTTGAAEPAPDLRSDPMTEPQDSPPSSPEAAPAADAPDLRSDPMTEPPDPVTVDRVAAEPEVPDLRSDPPVSPFARADPEPVVPPRAKPEPATEPLAAAKELGPTPEPRRRSGFVPALLGGVIAAGLGAGAALYLMPQGWQPAGPTAEEIARDEATDTQLAALVAEIEALKSAPAPEPDTSLIETTEALSRDLAAANDAQAEALTRLQDIETRLESLESGTGFGATSGGVEPGTVDAVRAEMEAMRQLIEEQRGAQQEVAAAAASAEERLAAAEAEAARLASEAEAAATAAQSRAALSHLRAALESGAPLAPVIETLSAAGLTVPEALTALPDGVPTLGSLQDSFPEAARAALAASLPVTAGTGTWDRVGAFLQAQTGARSLDPREGTDPDAVLSRAEAALTTGDLQATLAELEGLPAEGRAETAAWEAEAAARIAATGAADALAAEIQ
ncbi:hypothetical protein GVY41_10385 [Frigidibacter albus]|uniref:Mitochondrial inner membrane protein n=1 Tax=Frigidibacter albus TaxID=1465486 RepID=A0A6L8VGJ4_9RHOB|nr:hypothetical protein [Frigidibacter albus]MZQ89498.1 hypothetical protein [Frigidibacter albus]NBE31404.1 hypothetical protein [Frigidibacter albus]GGH55632.1 hypothetical protein GCM10011341_23340 [Frigidibacter albus]